MTIKPYASPPTPQKRQQNIRQISLDIVEYMLDEIRRQLPKLSMINESEKDQAIHPLYKTIFQEAAKRVIHDIDHDEEASYNTAIIGIEGFEPTHI